MGPNSIAILSIVAFITEIDDFSAVGVDAGGSTTYIGTIIQSLVVQPEGSTTRTLLSTPTTFGGGGVTIQAGGGPGGTDAASISALTMTGSATPWTTIKDPGPTATPTAAPNNGAGGLRFPSVFAVICLPVVGSYVIWGYDAYRWTALKHLLRIVHSWERIWAHE
ncbi:hypothetical protein BD779DRAFT_1568671 [Infundibulicybe gibba]|nr:hypothetical protein BD779DRAFT_1568671 [Infundibulicybe gibba]